MTQPVTGTNGNCTIPPESIAVAMNVTIVAPTAKSNLRLFPADVEAPLASNLNWVAGQSPTPNKVDVKLSADGRIVVQNMNGTVHVAADVAGYYTSSSLVDLHDRLSATEAEQPFTVSAHANHSFEDLLSSSSRVLVSVNVDAPTDGQVAVASAISLRSLRSNVGVRCSLTTESSLDIAHAHFWTEPVGGEYAAMAGNRVFDVDGGSTITINLVCNSFLSMPGSGSPDVATGASTLTAMFTPAA